VDRLVLTCSDVTGLGFLRHRLYVAKTMMPPGWETYFQCRATYRSVHTSTAIEGNQLGLEEATFVMVDEPHVLSPDQLEVKNLEYAYDLVHQVASDKSVRVDEGLVRTMNSMMQKDLPSVAARSRGKYRVGTTLIVNEKTREIRYRPPAAERVPELMAQLVKDLQDWIEHDTHPGPVIAALAHFGLISIHPFEDGNGRTARLLADLILFKTGWSNEGMVSVSENIFDRQQEYYDTLHQTQGEDFAAEVDATPFVQFHTDVLKDAAVGLEAAVVNFNLFRDSVTDSLRGDLTPRQVLGFMFMMEMAPVSTSVYAKMASISTTRALADLTEMTAKGWIERKGTGRSTRYRVEANLERSIRSATESKQADAAERRKEEASV
jgi:Fic family protein